MPVPAHVVAVLVSNPALSSILTMVLASTPQLRVRAFDSELGLATYMRLARVDLVVCDFDCEAAPADGLALRLRRDAAIERQDFQVVALAGAVTPEMKQASIRAGIDEIVIKPMSPKYLLERVLSRLDRSRARPVAGAARRHGPVDPSRFGSNVVPLFGRAPQATT